MEIELKEIIHKLHNLNILHRFYIYQATINNNLYFGQFPILEYVNKNDQCTQKELAEMMCVSAPSIATSVKRLQKAGLLDKITDEKDQRNNRITITEKGKELSEKCRIDFDKIDAQMFSGFSTEEHLLLCNYFDRLIANLSTDDISNKSICCFMKEEKNWKKKKYKQGEPQ